MQKLETKQDVEVLLSLCFEGPVDVVSSGSSQDPRTRTMSLYEMGSFFQDLSTALSYNVDLATVTGQRRRFEQRTGFDRRRADGRFITKEELDRRKRGERREENVPDLWMSPSRYDPGEYLEILKDGLEAPLLKIPNLVEVRAGSMWLDLAISTVGIAAPSIVGFIKIVMWIDTWHLGRQKLQQEIQGMKHDNFKKEIENHMKVYDALMQMFEDEEEMPPLPEEVQRLVKGHAQKLEGYDMHFTDARIKVDV